MVHDEKVTQPLQEFVELERALRRLGAEFFAPDTAMTLVDMWPRRRGSAVGFQVSGLPAGQDLFYVEPARPEWALPTVTLPDGSDVAAWQYPADPRLPALASAVYPNALQVLLKRMGISGGVSDLHLVGYRPGRRAVLRVRAGDTLYFVKIVRPDRVGDIAARHTAVSRAGIPTAEMVAWSPAGVLVTSEVAGRVLSDAAKGSVPAEVVVRRMEEVQSMLAEVSLDYPAREPAVSRREWYFDQAEVIHPNQQTLLRSLRARVEKHLAHGTDDSPVTIHGDLHTGQVFVNLSAPHQVVGVIDLDEVGRGFAADDAAALWAHSVATAVSLGGDHTGYWWEVVDRLVSSLDNKNPNQHRLLAGVVVGLVGHTLTGTANGAAPALEMLTYANEVM